MLLQASAILLVLLAASLPIAAVLLAIALIMGWLNSPMPLYLAGSEIFWGVSSQFTLTSIPLFILLGEILLRSGVAERMYGAVALWFNRIPGGLLHANIAASTLFAATSGSSTATAATIGTVALPEIQKRAYSERLFLGSLSAGGTLGILIPPSIHLILYGMMTQTSVPQLYSASLVPGLMLAGLFSLVILVVCLVRPAYGGTKIKATWSERMASLPDLLPMLALCLVVIGSIYVGLATPTEAASLGLIFAIVLAGAYGRLGVAMLNGAFIATMRTTTMIMLIVLVASFLNFVLSALGLPQALTRFVADLGLSPLGTMISVIIFVMILGCFLESLSMLLTMTPLLAPLVTSLGYDPLWFGVVLTILLEMALITPPVGMNLYVVQAIRERGGIGDVIVGAVPFVLTMVLMLVLLLTFPEIALWLPTVMHTN